MEDISCFEDDFLIEDGVLKSYTGRDECILVPDVHTIGEGAFKGCVSLSCRTGFAESFPGLLKAAGSYGK